MSQDQLTEEVKVEVKHSGISGIISEENTLSTTIKYAIHLEVILRFQNIEKIIDIIVYKRYSDFEKFHKSLKEKQNMRSFEFPEKALLNTQDVIATRKRLFSEYTRRLTQFYLEKDPEILDFFEITPEIEKIKKQSGSEPLMISKHKYEQDLKREDEGQKNIKKEKERKE